MRWLAAVPVVLMVGVAGPPAGTAPAGTTPAGAAPPAAAPARHRDRSYQPDPFATGFGCLP